jgi:hypothetical protein
MVSTGSLFTQILALFQRRHLQFRSNFRWAVSNLVALLRWNLFSYRDVWEWINRYFDHNQPRNWNLSWTTPVHRDDQPHFKTRKLNVKNPAKTRKSPSNNG